MAQKRERIQKKPTPRRRKEEEEQPIDLHVETERYKKVSDELDSILDEIDSVLEENAEEFVKNYIQKGGQ